MMPILEQTQNHHNHIHQSYYHQQDMPEPTGKIQLTLILPNSGSSIISVDADTPMMDLLVRAASHHKLNPSSYSLVLLDSNQQIIHFKPNQTIGQLVESCHLLQTNGSPIIKLLPKETTANTISTPKSKTQPFEITVRLQINLPDAQKILLRVDPTLPLHEIKEQVCKQKKYADSNLYTLRLPNKLDEPLMLGVSLSEYKTNELTLIYIPTNESDNQINRNHLQTFDRLYRTRSESQPSNSPKQELHNERQSLPNKQVQQTSSNRSSTIQPSHTTLHAYWNDSNFDTQSQLSNGSSTTKKRRAPRPPGYVSPNQNNQPNGSIQTSLKSPLPPQSRSSESVQLDTVKKKRRAPVIATIRGPIKSEDEEKKPESENGVDHMIRPNVEPPPPPCVSTITLDSVTPSIENVNEDVQMKMKINDDIQTNDLELSPTDNQHSIETQTSLEDNLVIQANALGSVKDTNHSLKSSPFENEEQTVQTEIPIAVESPQKLAQLEITEIQNESVTETIEKDTNASHVLNIPIPKPPRQHINKEKKSSTINDLIRIINDHMERGNSSSNNVKQEKETNENVSYFRVAKSRCGKFETDNRGFVHSSIAIFDTTNQQTSNKTFHLSEIPINTSQRKALTIPMQQQQMQKKAKEAYELLKKLEKEDDFQPPVNTNFPQEKNEIIKPSTPIQLEVIEPAAPAIVPTENDTKLPLIQTPIIPDAPPLLAPKPFGKTITEYRTVRRLGSVDETTSGHSTSTNNNDRTARNSVASHDELMEAIRKFGGSQNLKKIS